MKKLELKLDELKVDTFDVEAGAKDPGTVFGYVTEYPRCVSYNDPDCAGTEGGTGCNTNDACCWAGTHGGGTCETTCNQVICGCSAFATDCDATCPGYEHAEYFSCVDCN